MRISRNLLRNVEIEMRILKMNFSDKCEIYFLVGNRVTSGHFYVFI